MRRRSMLKIALSGLAAFKANDAIALTPLPSTPVVASLNPRLRRLYLQPSNDFKTTKSWDLLTVEPRKDTFQLGQLIATQDLGTARYGQFSEVVEQIASAGARRVRILIHGFDFEFQDGEPAPFQTIYGWRGRSACRPGKNGWDKDAVQTASWIESLDLLRRPDDAVIAFGWFSRGVSEAKLKEVYANYPSHKYGPNMHNRYVRAVVDTVYPGMALKALIEALDYNPGIKKVDIIAHSLGTSVALFALNQLYDQSEYPLSANKLGTVVLASGAAPAFYRDFYFDSLAKFRVQNSKNADLSIPHIYNVFAPDDIVVSCYGSTFNRFYGDYSDTLLDPTRKHSDLTNGLFHLAYAPGSYLQGKTSYTTWLGSFLSICFNPLVQQPEYRAIGQPLRHIPDPNWRDVNLGDRNTWQELATVAPNFDPRNHDLINHYVVLGTAENAAMVQSILNGHTS